MKKILSSLVILTFLSAKSEIKKVKINEDIAKQLVKFYESSFVHEDGPGNINKLAKENRKFFARIDDIEWLDFHNYEWINFDNDEDANQLQWDYCVCGDAMYIEWYYLDQENNVESKKD